MQLIKGRVLLSLLLITSVSSVPNTTHYRLNSMLFDGYDQYIIPVINTSMALEVTGLYSLSQVISIVSFHFLIEHRFLTAVFRRVNKKKLNELRALYFKIIHKSFIDDKFRMTRQKTYKYQDGSIL